MVQFLVSTPATHVNLPELKAAVCATNICDEHCVTIALCIQTMNAYLLLQSIVGHQVTDEQQCRAERQHQKLQKYQKLQKHQS